MRITFISPVASLAGGVRVVATYAERLRARGHTVTVVSEGPRVPSLKRKIRCLVTGHGWPRRERPQPSHLDGLDIEHRVLDRRRPVVDRDVPDADVVIATWWETAEWVMRLSPSKGAKVYFIQGYEVFPGQPRERVEATWRLPMHKLTIARWLADLGREQYADADISLVENSVDTRLFYAEPRGKQPAPTVGLLYSDSPTKGCDVSFRAIAALRRSIPGARLIAFGAERPKASLPLPPGTEFVFRPPQPEIREVYARLDVWLCGSRTEGFHLPPLEAMACRTPVVATRVGGAVEAVEPGVNGYLAEIGDHEGLAQGLRRVLELDERTWRLMSDAAYARARRYSWDDAAALFERALERAVERAARGEIAGGGGGTPAP